MLNFFEDLTLEQLKTIQHTRLEELSEIGNDDYSKKLFGILKIDRLKKYKKYLKETINNLEDMIRKEYKEA